MSFHEDASTVIDELREVMARVSSSDLNGLLRMIAAARRIVVIGVGREGLAARGFTMRLAHLGFDAHWVWDDTTPPIGAGDLLLAVSGSGDIGHIDYVVRTAQEAGAAVAVVTANPGGATAERADLALCVPAAAYRSGSEMVPSIQPMGSLFEESTWVVFDCLVLELERTAGQTHADLAERHRNIE